MLEGLSSEPQKRYLGYLHAFTKNIYKLTLILLFVQTLLAEPSSLFYAILEEKDPKREEKKKLLQEKEGISETISFTRTREGNIEKTKIKIQNHNIERDNMEKWKNILTLRKLSWKRDKKDGTIFLDRCVLLCLLSSISVLHSLSSLSVRD